LISFTALTSNNGYIPTIAFGSPLISKLLNTRFEGTKDLGASQSVYTFYINYDTVYMMSEYAGYKDMGIICKWDTTETEACTICYQNQFSNKTACDQCFLDTHWFAKYLQIIDSKKHSVCSHYLQDDIILYYPASNDYQLQIKFVGVVSWGGVAFLVVFLWLMVRRIIKAGEYSLA